MARSGLLLCTPNITVAPNSLDLPDDMFFAPINMEALYISHNVLGNGCCVLVARLAVLCAVCRVTTSIERATPLFRHSTSDAAIRYGTEL